jgi:homeobox-leucine zipper protein
MNKSTLLICSLFLECSHPDEKVRLDIANKIGMGVMQVKVWFQNRRSAKKVETKKRSMAS